ncbi:hypothetical protein OAB57_00990 [Bacteriovoracaceae bacterium]|nr:hypothetical protein [Bacteriovoracaceae bacterium]
MIFQSLLFFIQLASAELPYKECNNSFTTIYNNRMKFTPKRGSGQYRSPTNTELLSTTGLIDNLIVENHSEIIRHVDLLEMYICHNKTSNALAIAPKKNQSRFFLFWKLGKQKRLILESNHPQYDGTGSETTILFSKVNAKLALVSGYHRCSSKIGSGCSGLSKSCGNNNGKPIPYTISDSAHSDKSLVSEIHKMISDKYRDHIILNLHGMAAKGASISSARSGTVVSSKSATYLFARKMEKYFPDSYVTSCNRGTNVPYKRRVCGGTNIQGRHTNGSTDICTTPAIEDSGRFIHLEQGKDIKTQIDLLKDAINEAEEDYSQLNPSYTEFDDVKKEIMTIVNTQTENFTHLDLPKLINEMEINWTTNVPDLIDPITGLVNIESLKEPTNIELKVVIKCLKEDCFEKTVTLSFNFMLTPSVQLVDYYLSLIKIPNEMEHGLFSSLKLPQNNQETLIWSLGDKTLVDKHLDENNFEWIEEDSMLLITDGIKRNVSEKTSVVLQVGMSVAGTESSRNIIVNVAENSPMQSMYERILLFNQKNSYIEKLELTKIKKLTFNGISYQANINWDIEPAIVDVNGFIDRDKITGESVLLTLQAEINLEGHEKVIKMFSMKVTKGSCLKTDNIPQCAINMESVLYESIMGGHDANSVNYTPPTDKDKKNMSYIVDGLLLGKKGPFFQSLSYFNMNICRKCAGGSSVLYIYPKLDSNKKHTYLGPIISYRENNSIPYILESPHTRSEDMYSLSYKVFKDTQSKISIMNSFHSSASKEKNNCSALKNSSNGSYMKDTLFHQVHKLFTNALPESKVLQFHGVPKRVVSIGAGFYEEGNIEDLQSLAKILKYDFVNWPRYSKYSFLNSCTPNTVLPYKSCKYMKQIIQGRHLNLSKDVCKEPGTVQTNRFINIGVGKYVKERIEYLNHALSKFLPEPKNTHPPGFKRMDKTYPERYKSPSDSTYYKKWEPGNTLLGKNAWREYYVPPSKPVNNFEIPFPTKTFNNPEEDIRKHVYSYEQNDNSGVFRGLTADEMDTYWQILTDLSNHNWQEVQKNVGKINLQAHWVNGDFVMLSPTGKTGPIFVVLLYRPWASASNLVLTVCHRREAQRNAPAYFMRAKARVLNITTLPRNPNGTTTTRCNKVKNTYTECSASNSSFNLTNMFYKYAMTTTFHVQLHSCSSCSMSVGMGQNNNCKVVHGADQPGSIFLKNVLREDNPDKTLFTVDRMTSCGQNPHSNCEIKTCGNTAKESKMMNNSPDPCGSFYYTTKKPSKRFFHLELGRLRNKHFDWLSEAFLETVKEYDRLPKPGF